MAPERPVRGPCYSIMIFHLFIPALILGMTRLNNLTSSLFKDELTEIQDALQGNQTYAVIQEDNERFQDQETEFPDKHCKHDQLISVSHSVCGKAFHWEMQAISKEDWCILDDIIRPYHDLTECLQKHVDLVDCYFRNVNIEDFFLFIHSNFFQNCTNEEEVQFKDAPHSLVIVLTIIPVIIIPVLVHLVVSKS